MGFKYWPARIPLTDSNRHGARIQVEVFKGLMARISVQGYKLILARIFS